MLHQAPGPGVLREYLLRYEDLKLEKEVGGGAAGAVWLGIHLPTKREVAVKRFYGNEMTEQQKIMFYREVTNIVAVQHQFLLEFIGFTESPCCLVTKYIRNGSLFDILHDPRRRPSLSPTDMTVIAYGVSLGMEYIHSLKMIHRDLKPQNILIDENKMPVICDFGTSRQIETAMTGLCGTANYMAMEFLEGGRYDERVDVYSYGMVLWEMLTGEIPFEGKQMAQVIVMMMEMVKHGESVEIPPGTPQALGDLILACCSHDPDERPSFETITAMFQQGKVMFPGCDPGQFEKMVKLLDNAAKKRRTQSNVTQSQNVVKFVPGRSTGSLPTSHGDRNPVMTRLRNIQLGNSYLTSFTNGTEQQIRMSIDFFLAHADDEEIVKVDIWPKFLWLLVEPPPSLVDKAIELSVRLAQNGEILSGITKVPDLHTFLCPNTYTLFLYIVSFLPQEVNQALVAKLFEYSYDEKPVILLCKLLQTLDPESELSVMIADFFEANVMRMAGLPGGHLVLRRLSADGKIAWPMIQAFAQSEITNNLIATYECYFSLNPANAFVFTLTQILNHVVSESAGLRSCALEYLRRYARNAEGDPLRLMIEALVQCVLKYYEDKAVLLLCRIAHDPGNNCWEFQKREVAQQWLRIAPEKVPIMMKFFVCVFSQERMLPFVTSFPETADFLASAMKYGDNQCFLSACFMLKQMSFDDTYARRLDELEAIEKMVSKINVIKEPKKNIMIGKVIRVIGRIYYSEHFQKLVPMIIDSMLDRTPEMKEMIKTASVVSRHKPIAIALLREDIIKLMAKTQIPSDVSSYARTIYTNLNPNTPEFRIA